MPLFKNIILLTLLLNSSVSLGKVSNDLEIGDQYYDQRTNIDKAYLALAHYQKELDSNPQSIEGLWRASMANYYIGHLLDNKTKRVEHYQQGVNQGKLCVELTDSKRVECLFWLGTNKALLNREKGILNLAFGIGELLRIFEKASKVDSRYAGSGSYRMLALLYYKAPGFLGGDNELAYEYIKKAITQSTNEPLNYFYYMRFLFEEGKKDLAFDIGQNFSKMAIPEQFDYLESKSAYANIVAFLETKSMVDGD